MTLCRALRVTPRRRGPAAEKVDILARKLRPHGRLFIRKPTREQHGTPALEIRALMSTAGLHERESRMSRSLIMGEVFDGVFDKTPV